MTQKQSIQLIGGALLLLCPVSLVVAAPTNEPPERADEASRSSAVATVMPKSNVEQFGNWKDSKFDVFFYDTTADFSQYNAVIIFPMTFDRMQLSAGAGEKIRKSWQDSDFEEMDEICARFDEIAQRTFKNSRQFELTNRGGDNVLVVEFRMMNFLPTSMRREDALGTVGESSNMLGIGGLTLQAVIAESQTGRMLAVVKEGLVVSAGSYSGANRVGRNLAWRRSFQRVADKLHKDLQTLQRRDAGN